MLSNQLVIYPGNPAPLGFSVLGKKANFALFSSKASRVVLGLASGKEIREIPLNRTGDLWHAACEGWSEEMNYAFRIDEGVWLSDPASRTLASSSTWGEGVESVWSRCAPSVPFDWQGVGKPRIPLSDLVIYEMHVRGYTIHPTSGATHPGTYLGIIEKLPYLQKLGVNAIELMPIFEFDESLRNYWGYDPLNFFSPMRRYGATQDPVEEFKTLVREMHRAGIEVLLDVVYNHTGEAFHPAFKSFSGLDKPAYYLLDDEGRHRDFSGCKNTVNCNHPAVQELLLSSLRFWAEEMQVDGFRFDLASILTRDQNGAVLKNPPVLEAIRNASALKGTKLIAECWDAAGLYQLGQFPRFGPWSEWNGKFRDRVRCFLKRTEGFAGKFADVLCGSEFLYKPWGPLNSINFVTAHDGFSLNDLVSYNQKHNISNGQENKDGNNQNLSWNCGWEGPTYDPAILELRQRQMRNFLLALFLAEGVPMLLMGDEYGHTRQGNNNPYLHDNEINWFLWKEAEKRKEQVEFVSALIAFRKAHPELRRDHFLEDSDVIWHGIRPFQADWSPSSQLVACTMIGKIPIYLAFNAAPSPVELTLPPGIWREIVRTDRPWNEHHLRQPEKSPFCAPSLSLPPHSALLAWKDLASPT